MSSLPARLESWQRPGLPVPYRRLRVVACPNPFRHDREERWLAPGQSLLEILREVQPNISRYSALVWVGNDPIPPELWASTFPAPGAQISIRIIPQGGFGRLLGSIFIAIAAIAIAWWAGPALAGFFGFGSAAFWGGVAGMTVGIIGNLALNALFPPTTNPGSQAQLAGAQAQDSPTLSITGASNQANKWGPIPVLLGRHKIFPNYGADLYTEILGNDQYLHIYLVWCISREETPAVQIERQLIGDTALGNFADVQTEHRNLILELTAQTIAINETARTLTRTSGSWLAEGIKAGKTVTLSGCTTAANDGDYAIAAVTALVLTYASGPAITTEPGNGEQVLTCIFGDEPHGLYTNDIHEETEGYPILLEYEVPVVRTTQAGPDEISYDLVCPSGLYDPSSSSQTRNPKSVSVKVEIRESGGSWQDLETVTMTAATSSAVRQGRRHTSPGSGVYDLRWTRKTPTDTGFAMSQVFLSTLRSINHTAPFQPPAPCAETVMRIKASNDLSGTINAFSGIATSVCPDWDADTETWITRATQNPASLYRHWLQGRHKQQPMADSRITLERLQEWHDFCVENGWTYNKNIDYTARQKEVLDEIAAAGRAAVSWVANKWGVIIGQPQEFTIGPIFTPRNTANFKSNISYQKLPHAFRVPFRNELNDWNEDEYLVLADGYAQLNADGDRIDVWGNAASKDLSGAAVDVGAGVVGLPCINHGLAAGWNIEIFSTDNYDGTYRVLDSSTINQINVLASYAAETFGAEAVARLPLATLYEQLELPGQTHPDNIFKLTRFHLAVAKLQLIEMHQLDTDLLGLIPLRGDRIKMAHDVLLVGLAAGTVKSLLLEIIGWTEDEPPQPIYSGNLAGVALDESCPMEEGVDYCVTIALSDCASVTFTVINAPGSSKTLYFTEPVEPYDPGPPPTIRWPEVGNFFTFGESEKEVIDVLVHSYLPKTNLQATLKLIPYDAAVYAAAEGTIPAHDPKVTAAPAWWTPVISWVRSDGSVLWRAADGSWQSRILITLSRILAISPLVTAVEGQFWRTDSAAGPPFTVGPVFADDGEISLMPVEDGVSYDFRLRYVRQDGSRGPWTEIQTHVVEGKTAPPEDVAGFNVYQVKELVYFTWPQVPDLDLAGYELRYGGEGESWAASTVITQVMRGTGFATPMMPPGIWDFLIKAIDTSGNYSANEARKTFVVISFYQTLADLPQFPDWPGTRGNFIRNPRTGHLLPEDQNTAEGDNFDVFDNFVVNPYTEYTYITPEIDLGEDIAARAWARIASHLGPGESGETEPEMLFDYRLDGGSYDGFEAWGIGPFMGRYAKFKLSMLAANGLRYISDLEPVIDKSY